MKLPVYIAKRYIFSKKSHNLINILSGISVAGVGIGTMALIIVLSVFNGLEDLISSMYNSFNPDIKIEAKIGKTFDITTFPLQKLTQINGIAHYCEVVEENALLRYKNKQQIVLIKGVSNTFTNVSRVDSCMVEGKFLLQKGDVNFMVFGYGIYDMLGIELTDFSTPVSVYIPKRSKIMSIDPTEAFNNEAIMPSGAFSIQQDFDTRFVIVPLRFARKMMDYTNEVTALEISLKAGTDVAKVQSEIRQLSGNTYSVKNKLEQEELFYKIIKSEKLAGILILSFILLIAAFNIVGSLSMLIIEKKKDIAILRSLGASNRLIKRIFMTEGLMISLSGAILGLFLGGIIVLIQQYIGIIKLEGSGAFIVKYYPVQLQFIDFIKVIGIVFVIGFFATLYTVGQISQRLKGDTIDNQ
ncbi:MAG: ABC transporter permease [Bacteroidetes bacterium]|nr:ABC transporter permease [Bacteroidota bacterium]